MPETESDVVRVPAIQEFNASDFSVVYPIRAQLNEPIDEFGPDIVHSQHPFLLGASAVRIARHRDLPLVFTHHTLYEQYTHYVPGDSPALVRFTIELATRYANLCDQVFAPSESIRELIVSRGVKVPVEVVPTGVQPDRFARGDSAACRRRLGIPPDAFVVGHVGRLAPEKNLEFLSRACADFLADRPGARFLVVGAGPSESAIRKIFDAAGTGDRLHFAGVLDGRALVDALHAMDVFAFASKSETQGMVLTEAMAAGLPVVGLDASGVREVVKDRHNGRLLPEEDVGAFSGALAWVAGQGDAGRRRLAAGARKTAEAFSMPRCAEKALACYRHLVSEGRLGRDRDESGWDEVREAIRTEWELFKSMAYAGEAALGARLLPDRNEE